MNNLLQGPCRIWAGKSKDFETLSHDAPGRSPRVGRLHLYRGLREKDVEAIHRLRTPAAIGIPDFPS